MKNRSPLSSKRILSIAITSTLLLSASASHATPDVMALLLKTDDMMRGSSSEGVMSMEVTTKRWHRTMKMRVRSKGADKTLVQILSPAKEKGTATLKVDKNIWNYLPKVDRTIKIPSSMMSGNWMGSHLTNDDLVQESRYTEDFKCDYNSLPTTADDFYKINCIPHEDAAVVWGKVEIDILSSDELPRAVRFYDEKDKLVRTQNFEDVREMGGQLLPTIVRVTPADKPNESTVMVYEQMTFDVDLPDKTFSLQSLRRR